MCFLDTINDSWFGQGFFVRSWGDRREREGECKVKSEECKVQD